MGLREPNIERLLATYRLEKLDRVPNWDVIDPVNVQRIMGWGSEKRIVRSDMLYPEDAVLLARKTHMDTISVMLQYWPIDVIKIFSDGARICSSEDLEKIIPPKPDSARRRVLRALEAVKGTQIGVMVHIAAPLFVTYFSMGPIPIQSFMMNIYDDLPFIEELMDIQLENQIRIVEAIMDLPVSIIEIADDIAANNGYLVSPEFIERYWVPRADKLVKTVKRINVPIQWHCCGKIDKLIPQLLEREIDALTPIQTSCNDIYALKRDCGDKLCLVGNMNIEGVLAFGTPEEVIEDTREHIEKLSYNGGYVVASSHTIVDAIPTENYNAMIECAIEYGAYA
jgi:uroporphyrinogen-III decarboxylase